MTYLDVWNIVAGSQSLVGYQYSAEITENEMAGNFGLQNTILALSHSLSKSERKN